MRFAGACAVTGLSTRVPLEMQYRAYSLALVQQVERLVDLLERQVMGNEVVDVELAFHVTVDIARQLGATLDAAERGAAPDAPGDELERPRFDGFAGAGHTDNGGFTPALVATLQRRPHDLRVADAFERMVDTAVRHFDDDFLNRRVVILRIDAVSGAQLAGELELVRIDVDGDDAAGAGHHRALNHG